MSAAPEAPGQRIHIGIAVSVLSFLLHSLGSAARADIILDLDPASLTANPGDTVVFTGTVTNTTGVTLNATDLFLNFSGFDPVAIVDITQLLGSPDFVLENFRISPPVDLFGVTFAPSALPGTYSFDVNLLDINNNSSPNVTGTVRVVGAVIPEPSGWVMVATGLAGMAFFNLARRRRQVTSQRVGLTPIRRHGCM